MFLPKINQNNRNVKYLHRRALNLGYIPTKKSINPFELDPVVSVPPELITVGYVKEPIGIKGNLKVVYDNAFKKNYKTCSKEKKSLFFDTDFLWIHKNPSIFKCRLISTVKTGDFFRLSIDGINNREKAENLIGCYIKIPKEFLLKRLLCVKDSLELLNFKILNLSGKNLGIVEKIDGNGFHEWIFSGEIVIPLVDKYVKNVDPVQRQVIVDWEDFW